MCSIFFSLEFEWVSKYEKIRASFSQIWFLVDNINSKTSTMKKSSWDTQQVFCEKNTAVEVSNENKMLARSSTEENPSRDHFEGKIFERVSLARFFMNRPPSMGLYVENPFRKYSMNRIPSKSGSWRLSIGPLRIEVFQKKLWRGMTSKRFSIKKISSK